MPQNYAAAGSSTVALGDGEGVRVDAADGAFVVAPVPRATVELPAAA